MSTKPIKVAIITNVLPNYREGFYKRLFASQKVEAKVFCQSHIPGMSFKTIHDKFPERVTLMRFFSLGGVQFIWQFIPWLKITRNFDVIFIDGNPRILSQALFATFLRIIRKKVVIWSMVHSHNNNGLSEKVRLKWLKLFNYHFLYNDSDIDRMKGLGFGDEYLKIAMNNGLDQKNIDRIVDKWSSEKLSNWRSEKGIANKKLVLSCGRLVAKNKYELIAKTLPDLIKQFPNLLWCCIGGGEELENLKQLVANLGMEKHVLFTGAIFEDEELCPYFLSSELFIHPAAVGLSIMHAFGYGLPIVIHNNAEVHGPEFVAFEEGINGVSFEDGQVDEMTEVIASLLKQSEKRNEMSIAARQTVREKYNVDKMTNRFINMVETVVAKV